MAKKKTEKDGVFFVLEGTVALVERKGGKEISKEEIDGEVVLKILIQCVSAELDRLEEQKAWGALGSDWDHEPGAPGAPVPVKRSKRVKK